MKKLKDASLIREKYFPAAGSVNYTESINIGMVDGDPVNLCDIEVAVAAAALHVDPTKDLSVVLQHSDDDVTFEDTNPSIDCTVAGVASTGSVLATFQYRWPTDIKEYIRWKLTTPDGDGDCTGVMMTAALVF